MSTTIDLKELLKTTGADAILITDNEGNVIEHLNVENEKNIAAMTEMAFSMCKDLSTDLGNGELEQIFAKADNGFFIANRLKSQHILIMLSKNNSKLGLYLKILNSISK